MLMKNIKLFLRKYFLFLIPFFLLILYFLSPIPGAIFKSSSQTINQKERADEIIASYEYAISPEGIKQCSKECLNDATRRDRSLYLCKDRCRRKVFSPEKISPEEIERCIQKCEEPDELLSECIYHYCREIMITGRYIGDSGVYEIQRSSFVRLFFQNLKKEFIVSYQGLIKIFHFQNLIIIFLSLILYYGVIFGINITKRFEKQK